MTDHIGAFAEAMCSDGIAPPLRMFADGTLRRFPTNGRPNDDSGWYVLFDGDVPAGAYGDWRSGMDRTWRANTSRELTAGEKNEFRRRMDEVRRKREAERTKAAKESAQKAALMWSAAQPAKADHAYLVHKKIGAHGLRQIGGELIMPLRDYSGGIRSLQFISPNGAKRFLSGGTVKGGYYSISGKDPVCIVEGFATGASIHEATGQAVAVAFNAGNLDSVATALREKFPGKQLIVCADDDCSTEGNPGMRNATIAARASDALLAIPDFGSARPEGATDFNDLANHLDGRAVKVCIERAQCVDAERASNAGVEIVRADSVRLEPIRWLWRGWLACGKLHLLGGQAGTGKTTLALAIAAKITNAAQFPDGSRAPMGTTLMWSGEDDFGDSLLPRFMANGGNRQRLYFIKGIKDGEKARPFDPATDFLALAARASQIPDLKLLIVDPIVSAVNGDSHKNAEVRRSLQPLADFAAQAGVAVLGITHFTKGTSGRDPIERITGSLAFGAIPRVVMATAKPQEDGGAWRMVRAKSNIGPDGGGFEYSLSQTIIDADRDISGQAIRWGEPLDGTARELLAEVESPESESDAPARDEAQRWLESLLADGPVAAAEIERLAKVSDRSMRTVKRAKAKLGAISAKCAFGWTWELPKRAKECPQECQSESVALLASFN
ncbi:MAG TPA: AAA family ATPase [Rhizomicrobium sp.]|nr:AAA family ATPase [Rhizomicrobium sp.]